MGGGRKKIEEEWTKNEVGRENMQCEGVIENMLVGYTYHFFCSAVKNLAKWQNIWIDKNGMRKTSFYPIISNINKMLPPLILRVHCSSMCNAHDKTRWEFGKANLWFIIYLLVEFSICFLNLCNLQPSSQIILGLSQSLLKWAQI